VGKGKVELGTEEEKKQAEEELKEKSEVYGALMQALAKPLGEWVSEVRLSTRLTASPACLVGGEFDMSPQMQKMMREMQGDLGPMQQKRVLELNPKHEILEKLKGRYEADAEDAKLDDTAHLLLGYALLAEGSDLHDSGRFNQLIADLALGAL
jgi:molecular chaperone HtpG